MTARLSELAALQPGWLDGHGAAITEPALNVARLVVQLCAGQNEPYLYPTEDGGVQAEWAVAYHTAQLCCDPDGSALAVWRKQPGHGEATLSAGEAIQPEPLRALLARMGVL